MTRRTFSIVSKSSLPICFQWNDHAAEGVIWQLNNRKASPPRPSQLTFEEWFSSSVETDFNIRKWNVADPRLPPLTGRCGQSLS